MRGDKCSKCSNTAKPNQRYCKKCHAEYMKEWRLREKVRIKELEKLNEPTKIRIGNGEVYHKKGDKWGKLINI